MELLPVVSLAVSQVSCFVIAAFFTVWGVVAHTCDKKKSAQSNQLHG